MTIEQRRSLTGRLRNLIHGIFAVWVRDSERQMRLIADAVPALIAYFDSSLRFGLL